MRFGPDRRREGGQRRAGAAACPRRIVGLDVGTTGVKAVAIDLGTARRHVAIRDYPADQPAPGWQTQDPDLIVAAAQAALAECVAAGDGTEVAAISLSAAMHGLMALDADFRPLTPLLTWADARAVEEARRAA